MILIIGLGNIGEEYILTRHNVAWIVFDEILGDISWVDDKYANAQVFETNINEEKVVFVKPKTFMNNSGNVIPYFYKKFGINENDILVVQDEIDLSLGEIKISKDRGDAGHNGIKSIMSVIETKDFYRIRIGVSIKGEDGKLYKPDVLGNFNKSDFEKIKIDIAPKVKNMIDHFIQTKN